MAIPSSNPNHGGLNHQITTNEGENKRIRGLAERRFDSTRAPALIYE
jgi:hypothetical protein